MIRTQLFTPEVAGDILSWKNSGFSVWIGEKIEPQDSDARRFIARYIYRSPVSLEKVDITDDIISMNTEHKGTAEVGGTEFLRGFSPLAKSAPPLKHARIKLSEH